MPYTTTATPHGQLYGGRRSRGVECWYLGGGLWLHRITRWVEEVRQTLGYGMLHSVRSEVPVHVWWDGMFMGPWQRLGHGMLQPTHLLCNI